MGQKQPNKVGVASHTQQRPVEYLSTEWYVFNCLDSVYRYTAATLREYTFCTTAAK
jgi:hypothetical protein